MADLVSPEELHSLSQGKATRRTILKAAALTVGLAATGVAGGMLTSRKPEEKQPETDAAPKPDVDIPHLQAVVDAGYAMRTKEDNKMLDDTYPGIDLKFSGNLTVAKIRSISDPVERFLTAVGYLDVERSGRYVKYPDVWECNIYTMDLLQLLLGNKIISSRYSLKDRSLLAAPTDLDALAKMQKEKTWDEFNKKYAAFDSNMIDAWMREVGSKRYGWKQIEKVEDFTPGVPVLGVTKWERIQEKNPEIGHAFVLMPLTEKSVVLSQATDNIRFRVIDHNFKKANPDPKEEYHFWYPSLAK